MDFLTETTIVALIGFAGGIALGLASRIGRFCTMGAVEDLMYQGSSVRMRMWLLAISSAIVVMFATMGLGLFDEARATYLSFVWNPLGSVVGGLMFGYGMALAGHCGYGTLARLGGGDLRSFVIVLVMGISGYIALSGPLASLRVFLFPTPALNGSDLPGIAHLGGRLTGLSPIAIGLAIGLIMMIATLASSELLKKPMSIFWGLVVGMAVVSGWLGTNYYAENGFSGLPVESHTFAAPLGDTILYAMTASGTTLTFGIGSVLGVLTGAFIGSLIKGHFRWEACEDPRELRRQITGAALMGVGAILAFGCTIGQGVSAFSMLFYGAPVTFLCILAGASIGLRQLIEGFYPAE